ncbi:MAG: undecaprenyl/decaprenyl-phosphate alpha-N-acetylglucosaminyl 1-phosphate transferase [Phycisphaerales bacterium]|nr:undecaprenyl/decaprenyl-phosphate alpha-N-acetylglucosaminyl 1-phosphate transferase [Phycisphaerales bacterium]
MPLQLTGPFIERHAPLPPEASSVFFDAIDTLNIFAPVFITGFLITLVATPVVRKIAIEAGVIDAPDRIRKHHSRPIAYLGGLAIFMGFMAAMLMSFIAIEGDAADLAPVPISILVGATAIALTGLADDIWKWDARLKIAGQLVAAAALAVSDIGIGAVTGVLQPFFGPLDHTLIDFGVFAIHSADLYYWVGTFLLGFVIIAGCNATNLLDGLDGLLTGSTSIMASGFLAISLLLASTATAVDPTTSLVGARVVMSLALLGTMLGFLPWNFNPAVIFLGDCGSLLIGYLCVTTVLLFGEQGAPSLVVAGFIIFGLPIIDTSLAIIRRKIMGVPMNTPDANHIHHQLRRSLGSVKKAVFALYGVTLAFTILGVAAAAIVLLSSTRVLVVYSIGAALFGVVIAVAVKVAFIQRWSGVTAESNELAGKSGPPVTPAVPDSSLAKSPAEHGA